MEEEKLRNLRKYASLRRTVKDLWEYKVVNTHRTKLRETSCLFDWKDELNGLGQEGWELMASSNEGDLVFKRRIPDNQLRNSDDYF